MGWRYKAGLFLIAAVLLHAFSRAGDGKSGDYKQPFAVTYLSFSYGGLPPLAFLKIGYVIC
uniref:CASP-like protein n=1 Tax=Salix viminalis TaxID=40686 RepID=A0A6N2KAM9_SALVM